MSQKLIRAFICIDFTGEVVKEVARIQEILEKKNIFTGKLIELENIHLTLKFLGHVNSKTLNKVKQKLSEISFQKLNLRLDKVGIFNYNKNPRIIWIKVLGVNLLQKQIDASLKNLFPEEQRFMSHLTIARVKHVKSLNDFYEYIKNLKCKPLNFQVSSFKLKSSDLSHNNFATGPVYKTLHKYKAKKTNMQNNNQEMHSLLFL